MGGGRLLPVLLPTGSLLPGHAATLSSVPCRGLQLQDTSPVDHMS